MHEIIFGINTINTQVRNGAFPRWDLPMFQGHGILGVDYRCGLSHIPNPTSPPDVTFSRIDTYVIATAGFSRVDLGLGRHV